MKRTLKESYDLVEYVPIKIRGYLDLFRPFTLFVAFFSALALTIGVAGHYGVALSQSWKLAVRVATTFAIVTAASNALNQVTDVEEDSISKSYRPIPQGIVSEEEALTLALMTYFIGIARAFITSTQFGVFVLAIAGITIIYSLDPVRLKRRLIINNLSLAVARGPLPVYAVWSLYGPPTEITKTFAIALLIYLFAGTTAKDFTDIEGDLKRGNRTLPAELGPQKAIYVIWPFFLAPYVLFARSADLQLLLISFPLAAVTILSLRSKTSDLMEYNKAWIFNYLNLASLYILFAYTLYL